MHTIAPSDFTKDEALLFSIHIPKTAGTTFGKVLQNYYTDAFMYLYPLGEDTDLFAIGFSLEEVHENQQLQRGISLGEISDLIVDKNISCIHGHIYGEFRTTLVRYLYNKGKKISFIAFIREPISRAYSELCHHKIIYQNTDPDDRILEITGNTLFRYLGCMLYSTYVCHTEDFDYEMQKLGFPYSGIKENVTENKNNFVYNEEMIQKYNDKDVLFYKQILSRFPRH